LRSAPPLEDAAARGRPDDALRPLVRALLTPVRSGMILTRTDLHACAAELGVGAMRMTERATLLEDLLRGEVQGALAWLIEQADRWRASHETWKSAGGGAAEFWLRRVEATRGVLESARSG
jgi:hypothetical protein